MLSEILTIVESACSFQEGSLSMDPNCAVEEISDSLQSCLPFSGTENNSQSLVLQDISGSEVLVGAFSSINIGKSPGQGDVKGKDKVKFGDASVINRPDTTCSSRSACTPKLNQKTQRRKTARKCGRTVVKKPLFDSVLLRVARKRRSYFCKPARSSVWGSLGYIAKIFECSSGVDVNQIENAKSRKARGAQGSRKRNKIHSQSLKRKSGASSGRIRLKVTLGKNMVHSFQTNMVSVTDNDLRNYWATTVEVPKSANGSENKLKEEVPGINGYKFLYRDQEKEKVVLLSDAHHRDMCVANKDLESHMICEKSTRVTAGNHQLLPSQMGVEGAGVAVDNRYLDSGTSPDSEVINLIPEAQVNGKVQEDWNDVLISSQGCVAPGDCHLEKSRTSSKKGRRKNKLPHAGNQDCVSRGDCHLDVPRTSSKKGRKKNKLPHAGNLCVEDRLPIPEIINSSTVLETHGPGEKIDDGFCSSEASISTTRSSSEGFSMGALSSSIVTNFGVSFENLHVEGRTEEDKPFRLGVGLESPEPNISMKLCPYTKIKGRKHLKSSKTSGVRKSGSEVSDSPSSQRGNASRQEGNPLKSVSRRKVKGKGGCAEIFRKVENHPETGDHSSDVPVKVKTSNESITRDVFNLDKLPRGLGEQYLPPRNAWVRCDDCLKWRRIAATLADSIEETNSRWICKDNVDKGFADCSIPQEKSNAEINAELEISDASCEEDASDTRLNSKRWEQRTSTVHQQSSWMLIKSNLFLHRSRKSQTIDEIMVCHCKPPLNGRMGCGDGCLNRILNIECVKGTCPCGERCSNQQFQKHKYSKLRWFRCGKKGYGLQSLEDISEGQFLIEYVGEVLDMQAYEARQKKYASMGHKHFYFMTLNGSEVIDACAKGNLGRFINHSCDPNCRTEKWMVKGEVCIGLFALRDIRKGEEVTFDYNYVRVFGAAAKECVCGSSQCRGYIGGDPQNTEVIVQGDSDEEYPEPVMFYEDGEIDENLKHLISATSSFDGTDMQIADSKLGSKDKVDKSATVVGHLESPSEIGTAGILIKDEDKNDESAPALQHLELTTENSLDKSASGAQLHLSLEMDNSVEKLPPVLHVENSSQLDDVSNKNSSEAQQEFVKRLESSELTVISSKSLSDTLGTKKKGKSETIGDRCDSKSRFLMKTSRLSSSVKKGKLTSNSVNMDKSELMVNKTHVQSSKPRKIMEGSLNGRFEAVEEKLNELLDADGGISKRKDATKGYLKLLLLTATSGDSGNGEAIQSNRDLSMILDALLKTKSRMVLIDIINKNGLQMLHNIMKRYRREFNKIPILRKLLKVLEYLAVREILTLEHINGGPPCPGVESFRESILTLTEHDDKQVHQIARNFRDRWIPKPVRKSSCIDRSDGRVEFLRGSNCNRYSASYNHWRDLRSTETINCSKQSIVPTNSVDAGTVEGCSASGSNDCPVNGTKTRKRKSRWDQPAEIKTEVRSPQHKEPKIQPSLLQNSHSVLQPELCRDHNVARQMVNGADDEGQNIDEEDVPPGFSPLTAPLVPSNASSTITDINRENGIPSRFPCEVVMGHPNGRFNNRLTLSYGLPLPVVQQFGTPQAESMESWVIAPGLPFHPFPPLPPYPRDRKEPPPCAGNPVANNRTAEKGEQCTRQPASCYSDQNPPSTSGATSLSEVEIQGANNQHSFQRFTGTCSLGKRHFRQQKWNNLQVGPPWLRKRNGWGFMGNNSRNGMCSTGVASVPNEIKGPNSSEYVNTVGVSACNSFHHYPHQQK